MSDSGRERSDEKPRISFEIRVMDFKMIIFILFYWNSTTGQWGMVGCLFNDD